MTLAVSVVVAKNQLVMNANYLILIRSEGIHIESRNNNHRDNIDNADIGIVGIGIAQGHTEGLVDQSEVSAGHTEVSAGHTETSAGHTEVSVGHTEVSVGHTEGSVGHTEGSVEHTEGSAGHTEVSVEHTEGSVGYNIENTTDIGDRPGMFQHLLE